MTREDFGDLFRSSKTTVCEWEIGRCVPRLSKLINISNYFSISLDCLLNGTIRGSSALEEMLGKAADAESPDVAHAYYAGQFLSQFSSLPIRQKERIIGYLDALCREGGV